MQRLAWNSDKNKTLIRQILLQILAMPYPKLGHFEHIAHLSHPQFPNL